MIIGHTTLFGKAVLYLFFFTIVDHVHALGHGHDHGHVHVPGVVVVDLGWMFRSRCSVQMVALHLLRRPW